MRFGRPSTLPTSVCVNATTETSLRRPLRPVCCPGTRLLGSLALSCGELRDDLFLDLADAVLAEEDLVADVEGGRTERAARHGIAGVLDQLFLDLVLLGPGDDAVDIETGGQERLAEHLRIVHLFRLDPHVMV